MADGNATSTAGEDEIQISPFFNSSTSPFPEARAREQFCVPAGSTVLLAETPGEICLMGLLSDEMEGASRMS